MYFKLSLKNVKKSFRDYTIYFITLCFSVSIFYIFNSIEAQKAMMEISASANTMMKTITQLMGAISVFVTFILAFLIIYANRFLIRRRKKELGIYMTLGMEKGKMAKLLVCETFLIGILSLGVGLLIGVLLSQGLSVVTARLFEVDMTGYQFIFSSSAFIKTLIYFGIIFVLVMIFSTFSISQYKLIDLIYGDRKNETQRLRNPVVTIILFILSILCLGLAYGFVLKNGIGTFDYRLVTEMVLGAVGTFLFFASLSGFFLKIIQSNKKRYYKDLNMFILRQINSRINTAHISISFICLMLFCTIGILSTGLGANSALSAGYRFSTPFDASFYTQGQASVIEKFKTYDFDILSYADGYVEFSLYQPENVTKGLIFDRVQDMIPPENKEKLQKSPMVFIKLSDFNKLMALQGQEEIRLGENQVALFSDYAEYYADLKECLETFINMKYPVTLNGIDYEVYPTLQTKGVYTTSASVIMTALVVPDPMVEGCKVEETILSLNCKGEGKAMQRKLENDLFDLGNKHQGLWQKIQVYGSTAEEVKSIIAGSKATVSFVCVYLGLIFLLTSAAVLALQQVSEAADNRKRYEILQKIGAEDKLIHSALLKQIAIYFILPLALAVIHSVVGIKVANDVLTIMGGINALANIIITALLITLVYGSYFIATYYSSKRILLRGK